MSEEKKMAYLLERYNKRILCGDPWEPIDLCSYLNGWGWASPLAVAWGG